MTHASPGWLFVACLAFAACGEAGSSSVAGGTASEASEQAAVRQEAAVLVRLLDEDPARQPLVDVQRAIDDDRPVRASELLETIALPAARRVASDARAVGTTSAAGAALRDRTASALEARQEALAAYARALARGPIEDLQLLDAMRDVRRAEQRIADMYQAAEAARDGRSRSGSTGAPP